MASLAERAELIVGSPYEPVAILGQDGRRLSQIIAETVFGRV